MIEKFDGDNSVGLELDFACKTNTVGKGLKTPMTFDDKLMFLIMFSRTEQPNVQQEKNQPGIKERYTEAEKIANDIITETEISKLIKMKGKDLAYVSKATSKPKLLSTLKADILGVKCSSSSPVKGCGMLRMGTLLKDYTKSSSETFIDKFMRYLKTVMSEDSAIVLESYSLTSALWNSKGFNYMIGKDYEKHMKTYVTREENLDEFKAQSKPF
jgi:hypothetical protein